MLFVTDITPGLSRDKRQGKWSWHWSNRRKEKKRRNVKNEESPDRKNGKECEFTDKALPNSTKFKLLKITSTCQTLIEVWGFGMLILMQKKSLYYERKISRSRKQREKKEILWKIIISSDFEKTILLYDVGNYNYDVGKTQKRVTKATGYV